MSPNRRNIELKSRCPDADAVERKAIESGFVPTGVLNQTDTYFNVADGRLKLRESDDFAELIWYLRADHSATRRSEYQLAPVADPAPLRELMLAALGVRGVVRKVRRLLLWRNVRLHLDKVDGLGSYLEFEAVIGAGDDEQTDGHDRLAELCRLLSLDPADRVSGSYSDLLGL